MISDFRKGYTCLTTSSSLDNFYLVLIFSQDLRLKTCNAVYNYTKCSGLFTGLEHKQNVVPIFLQSLKTNKILFQSFYRTWQTTLPLIPSPYPLAPLLPVTNKPCGFCGH